MTTMGSWPVWVILSPPPWSHWASQPSPKVRIWLKIALFPLLCLMGIHTPWPLTLLLLLYSLVPPWPPFHPSWPSPPLSSPFPGRPLFKLWRLKLPVPLVLLPLTTPLLPPCLHGWPVRPQTHHLPRHSLLTLLSSQEIWSLSMANSQIPSPSALRLFQETSRLLFINVLTLLVPNVWLTT